ncbi:MAG: cysteine hydrolase [Chlorobi bacterium]|nr:cysteine hydrolase [Chlorobiota bacterium]
MKKIKLTLLFLALIPLLVQAQEKTPEKRALIIVDIQQFYFPDGFYPLVNPEQASLQAAKVLKYFRDNGELVIHVKHATKKDSLINKNVAPIEGEKVFTKHYANSFRETGLLDYLRENQIKQVVICGMQTHMCVEAAARAAADYGFDVIVIGDACATRNVVYKGDTVKAADVHASTLGSIEGYYGKVMTTEEFLKQK